MSTMFVYNTALLSFKRKEGDTYMNVSFFFAILEALFMQITSFDLADWCSIIGLFLTVHSAFHGTKKKRAVCRYTGRAHCQS